MKHVSLASRYRPQSFAEVAGQEMIKNVLSRAAKDDHVAAGYLLCGTRGVGKTTIARIFAKALNCEHAPAAEPCNVCENCKRITQGNHPDVIEMDGASNNSVEDARALRENIGYAPMEGRYKVFIIDEAHMLTKSAFNALLKTLEEPPQHVTFIFATTEVHRFPATILSRCQVFSFHNIPEEILASHLTRVLNAEKIPFEETAVHLIARRGAGSVRDSMSLLDQTLAYTPERLTTEMTRQVLGLAGVDAFEELFAALSERNCAATARFARTLASREVDIGFFVRELVSSFRSLFLIRECGSDAAVNLGIAPDELELWKKLAPKFTPGYLHAGWQMILDAQRRITSSQEPAAALELLLLNLTLLPRLLSPRSIGTALAEGNVASAPASAEKVPQSSEGADGPHPT